MSEDSNLKLLHDAGDPLEKIICRAVEPLFPVISPYARVWAQHIYPRRIGDGSQVITDWMPFAGSHYTALIRLYHAYCAKQQLLAQCKHAEIMKNQKPTVDDYTLLLEVHATCAAFWENLGSAVDNFGHVWDDARRILLGNAKKAGATEGDEPISYKDISREKYPLLNYAYDRRTQFIHSVLVPNRFQEGLVVFNLRHYDAKATVWLTDTETIEAIDYKVAQDWPDVLKELGLAWERLFSWLQSKDKSRPESSTHGSCAAAPPTTPSATSYDYAIIPAQKVGPISGVKTPPSGSKS